jgi:predicted 3-demethylubiquinone-9 3-methyltransferase (glyoxalase superfamily)
MSVFAGGNSVLPPKTSEVYGPEGAGSFVVWMKADNQQRKHYMQKITPFLWFDGKAEEAANFYTSIFKNSKVLSVMRYGEGGPGPKGTVMSVTFQLEGQPFMALNGGPLFTFSPAISFFVNCQTQEEVDELWEKLSRGGEKQRCAWLKDQFGVSWQIVPTLLGELLQDKDPEKSKRVMQAMMQMDKIDIKRLQQAYERQ